MRWFESHPNADLLGQFATRSLDGGEERSVARHLGSCEDCRDTVMMLRAVSSLERGEPPAGLLARVLESRASGQRAILPLEDNSAPVQRRLSTVIRVAVAVAAVAAAIVLIVEPQQVTASDRSGLLRFHPARPVPGATLQATYVTGALLNRYDSLVLRGRLRRPADPQYNQGPLQQVVAVLHRSTGSGAFRATFRLPDSVVFAAFAVESPVGDVVDDNGGRLWELVTSDQAGKPLFDGLAQKIGDLMGRNWEQTLSTARQLATSYPDEPQAWAFLLPYERWVLGDSIAETLLPSHRRRLAAFQNRFAEQRALPHRTIAGMESYAIQVDDHSSARYWIDRRAREFPGDPDVLFRQENRLRNDSGWVVNPRLYFATAESLWARMPSGSGEVGIQLANNGLAAALQTGDTSALRVWSERYEQVDRDKALGARYVGRSLAHYPSLRAAGLDALRRAARLLSAAPDQYRPLGTNAAAYRAASHAVEQRVLADLAGALLMAGDTAAALDTLKVAVGEGWNTGVFHSMASMWLATGDTVEALRNYARLAADPAARVTLGDSLRALQRKVPAREWDRWVADAQAEMRAATLTGTEAYLPAGAPRLEARDGTLRNWADLTHGRVTLVAFWSRHCGYAVRDLPALQRLAGQLNSMGAEVVTIADEPMSDALRAFLRGKRLDALPAFGDPRGNARRAFSNFATPSYYVLDAAGRIVFAHSELDDVPLQIAALLPGAP